jgi:hypothetical protein
VGEASELPVSAQIMRAAKDHFGKADALALALRNAGVAGEDGRPYTDSSVSKWTLGQTRIPAEALLTAARLAKLSIDRYLFRDTEPPADPRMERLEARLALLEEQLTQAKGPG